MPLSLEKGERVSLEKVAPGVTRFRAGLGWKPRGATAGEDFDLDGLVLLVGSDGKVIDPEHGMIFYNNLTSQDGAITHHGDNTTGEGEGDDEVITLNLPSVTTAVERVPIIVSIHKAKERNQSFTQVDGAYVRLWDADKEDAEVSPEQFQAALNSKNPGYQEALAHILAVRDKAEVLRYDLSEDAGKKAVVVFAELYRKSGGWSFRSVDEGYDADKGLKGLAIDYGVAVA